MKLALTSPPGIKKSVGLNRIHYPPTKTLERDSPVLFPGTSTPFSAKTIRFTLAKVGISHLRKIPVFIPHSQGIGRVLGHIPLRRYRFVLAQRNKIELPLPRFGLTILNSVTFMSNFSLFRLNLATLNSPKAPKFKIYP